MASSVKNYCCWCDVFNKKKNDVDNMEEFMLLYPNLAK